MRYLIIEAQAASRRLLKQALSESGSCDCVQDPDQGVRQFVSAFEAGRPYSLVFLDLTTPDWGGLEALQEMREHEQELGIETRDQTRVLMTTDIEDVDHIVKHLRRGCHGYLIRPFTGEEILDALGKMSVVPAEAAVKVMG